ncbi:hypothetical protein [Ensifer sp. SL37]|uniref:hypothetical protein n=1 Tax=Ensifer sp. SL37 TaxID=2995137 RepID=UPI00227362BB|nr:hypothetical protein [Ensifer sp. SL37]MCY1741458.1 hypothetical protein [Ensifer sp. SL37]
MSDNAELIKAIKDAENAITKAINLLKGIAENNEGRHKLLAEYDAAQTEQTNAIWRQSNAVIEEALERVLTRRDKEKIMAEHQRAMESAWNLSQIQCGKAQKRSWFK